ncbi:MAG TPA: hypothetical protein V6C85_36890 [Allocoleopsis sp.]
MTPTFYKFIELLLATYCRLGNVVWGVGALDTCGRARWKDMEEELTIPHKQLVRKRLDIKRFNMATSYRCVKPPRFLSVEEDA